MSPDESKAKRAVLREFSALLRPLGFRPCRTSYFVRMAGDYVEFIHLHKFTFTLAFRVHCGVRALDDATTHAVLNGPDSDSVATRFPNPLTPRRRYTFSFDTSEESSHRCAESMFDFCRRIGEPWFSKRRNKHTVVGRRASKETVDLFRLSCDEQTIA